MKLIAGVFSLFVLTISGAVSCLSGLLVLLSFVVSFQHYDCILGVLMWGILFLCSAPFTILSAIATYQSFSSGRKNISAKKPSEITVDLPTPKIRRFPFPLQLRAPNAWQTGLLISSILFIFGLIWNAGN